MDKELRGQLKNFKTTKVWVNPDPVWVGQNRACLLEQITNTVVEEEQAGFSLNTIQQVFTLFIPGRLAYSAARSFFVFLLVGAIAASGWIASVSATQNCLPGELCYGVKLAAEKTQELVMTVTGSNEGKTQMHLEFASRRAQEIKKVVENKEESFSENAATAMKGLKNSIESVSNNLENTGKKQPEKMMALVKDVNKKTEEIAGTLKEVTKQTEKVDAQLTKDVAEAKKIVDDAALSAVEAVVQTQSEGGLVGEEEEVKNMVRDKINGVLVHSEETQAEAKEVKDISNASATSSDSILLQVPSFSIIVSSSEVAVTTTLDLKKIVDQAVQKADENSATVKGVVDEAKNLVDNNQLLEAIQKVKEGNQATSQAQQIVAEAKQAVKEVLPGDGGPVPNEATSSSLFQDVVEILPASEVNKASSTEKNDENRN